MARDDIPRSPHLPKPPGGMDRQDEAKVEGLPTDKVSLRKWHYPAERIYAAIFGKEAAHDHHGGLVHPGPDPAGTDPPPH